MISENIEKLKEHVLQAAHRAGREASNIKIVLVTKTVPVERIKEALACGFRDFGENRVQELLDKSQTLQAEKPRWHMIGHLQTNKVKQVIDKAVLIHSLDRPELASEIEKQAAVKGIKQVDCLIQVNTSKEDTKFGLAAADVENFAAGLQGPAIRVRGLMTIGPLTDDKEQTRVCFRALRELAEKLKKRFPEKEWEMLSMGMSGDYEMAIEEGSTLVRVGTAVFGERRI